MAALGFVACIAGSFALSAQTLDEVLAKINDAKGGVAKIKAVKSQIATGKVLINGGAMKVDISMTQQRPKMFRMEQALQGVKGIQAFDGKTAWQTAPWAGIKEPQVMSKEETEETEEQADIDGETIDYKEKGYKLELLGKEDIEGAPAYKIKVTKKNGNIATQFYDADSYLLVKQVSKRKNPQTGAEVESEMLFSDYRKVEGLTFPFQMEQRMGGKTGAQIVMDKMELNKPIDEKIFMMTSVAPAADAKK
jgi:outer membrane lipoprotein-sorting protein